MKIQRTDNRLGQTTPQIFLSFKILSFLGFFAHVEYFIKIEEAKSKIITKTETQMDFNSVSLEPLQMRFGTPSPLKMK